MGDAITSPEACSTRSSGDCIRAASLGHRVKQEQGEEAEQEPGEGLCDISDEGQKHEGHQHSEGDGEEQGADSPEHGNKPDLNGVLEELQQLVSLREVSMKPRSKLINVRRVSGAGGVRKGGRMQVEYSICFEDRHGSIDIGTLVAEKSDMFAKSAATIFGDMLTKAVLGDRMRHEDWNTPTHLLPQLESLMHSMDVLYGDDLDSKVQGLKDLLALYNEVVQLPSPGNRPAAAPAAATPAAGRGALRKARARSREVSQGAQAGAARTGAKKRSRPTLPNSLSVDTNVSVLGGIFRKEIEKWSTEQKVELKLSLVDHSEETFKLHQETRLKKAELTCKERTIALEAEFKQKQAYLELEKEREEERRRKKEADLKLQFERSTLARILNNSRAIESDA